MLLTDYKWFKAESDGQAALPGLVVRRLGLQDYEPIWKAMAYLARHGDENRDDEIWLLSHKPVFTQGQAGKAEHILDPGAIPVVQVDRGGQVTYHGPGQLVAYLLLNVKRRKLGVRALVDCIEQALLLSLRELGIEAATRPKAPGVYVEDAKIAALGLRIKNGWSYHGLSLNVNMDLGPFAQINPCGFVQLPVTRVADFVEPEPMLMQKVSRVVCDQLLVQLGYQPHYAKQE